MDNDYEMPEDDLLGIWLSITGFTLTGGCAFCGKYADLVTTTADDLTCKECRDEFEAILNAGDTSTPSAG